MHVLFLAATSFLWGGSYVASKTALLELGPLHLAALRYTLSAAILAGWLALAGGFRRYTARDWWQFTLLGVSGMWLFNMLLLAAIAYSTASEAAMVMGSSPAFNAMLAAVFLKERLVPRQWGGVFFSLAGLILVVRSGPPPGMEPPNRLLGDLFAFAALLCWATYQLVGKGVIARHGSLPVTAMANLAAAALFLPLLWHAGATGRLAPHSGSFWWSVAYLSVLAGAFAYVWWYKGMEGMGVAAASVFINLVPVHAAWLSALLLGERLSPGQMAGGAVVIAGVLLSQRSLPRLGILPVK